MLERKQKKKGRSVQDMIGIKRFTRYGLMTERGELLFYLVSPTNISVLSYDNIERKKGKTKWSFWKLFRYALDGIIEYTNAPLEISFVFGGFLTFVTTIELIILLIMSLCGKVVTTATILISLILFIGGCILLAIGILGEYMSKTYSEVKGRPQYIVRKFYD